MEAIAKEVHLEGFKNYFLKLEPNNYYFETVRVYKFQKQIMRDFTNFAPELVFF